MSRQLYLPGLAGALIALALVAGAAAGGATEALAATSGGTVTCPTVDPTTGDLTPNWANGVDWAGCNLTGANLYEAELFDSDLAGANLTDANLQGADVSGADVSGANLTDATFDGGIDVSGTILAGATLTGARTGGLIGTPASIPADWALVNGYLAGPGADLAYANLLDQDLTGVDLTGANLSAADLRGTTLTNAVLAGADLSEVTSGSITGTPASLPANWEMAAGYLIGPSANLSSSTLTNVDLSGLDLENVTLSGSILTDANLTNADLTGADLSGLNLTGTELAGATLTGEQSGGITGDPASLPAGWTILAGYLVGPGAVLTGLNLGGLDLAGYDLAGAQLGGAFLVSTNLSGANLDGANLSDATLNNANLSGADLSSANLSDTPMSAVDLSDANLTDANLASANIGSSTVAGATFTGAILTGVAGQDLIGTPAALPANWRLVHGIMAGPGADLDYADLDNDNLAGADLSGAAIQQASLQHTNLSGANLSNVTSLEATNLSFVNLSGANLTDASLNGGNLSYANLTQANLTGATATDATLAGATWDDTTCPDGSNSNAYADGCFSSLDTTPPSATPAVSHGTAGEHGWYASEVTVAWNWHDNGTIRASDCQQSSTTTGTGTMTLNATCADQAGNVGHSSFTVKVDTTQPQVTLSGVRAGAEYALGAVPRIACHTTEGVSGVADPARLTSTTTGKGGVGSFTATCSGAVSEAGTTQHAPVTVRYSVAYGFGGFSTPRAGRTMARRSGTFVAEFRLTAAGKSVSAAIGQALASRHMVRATLAGPGISPITAMCGWSAKARAFTCTMRLPRGIRSGRGHAYSLQASEDVGARFTSAPGTGHGSNPEVIYFR